MDFLLALDIGSVFSMGSRFEHCICWPHSVCKLQPGMRCFLDEASLHLIAVLLWRRHHVFFSGPGYP